MYKYLSELEDAHLELMNEYLNLLNKSSLLSFFIDVSSIRQRGLRKNKRYAYFLDKVLFPLFYPILFLMRFFTWKPVVNGFVEDHIKTKLLEISKIYSQLSQNLDNRIPSEHAKIEWLIKTSKSCETFSNTLFSWGKLRGSTLWVINVLTSLAFAYYGKDFFLQFFFQNLNNPLQLFLFTATSLTIFSIYGFAINLIIIFSYEAKRTLFTPNIEGKYFLEPENEKIINVYRTENNLFELFGRKKKLEFPLDIALLLFFYAISPMLLFLLALIMVIGQLHLSLIDTLISFSITIIPFLVIGNSYLREWENREWR